MFLSYAKCVPKLPGVYHISAMINGDSLAESPGFIIEVQKQKLEVDGELHLQNGTLQKPADIAVNSKGLIAIAEYEKSCILICDEEGKIVRQVGCKGENPGQLGSPTDVTFINNDEILVAQQENHRVQHFNVHSEQNSFGRQGTEDGNFTYTASVCVDDEGRIIVSDLKNHRVQVLTRDGALMFKLGDSGSEKLNRPLGCVCYKNMFIVVDSGNSCLKVFNSSGNFIRLEKKTDRRRTVFKAVWSVCRPTWEYFGQ